MGTLKQTHSIFQARRKCQSSHHGPALVLVAKYISTWERASSPALERRPLAERVTSQSKAKFPLESYVWSSTCARCRTLLPSNKYTESKSLQKRLKTFPSQGLTKSPLASVTAGPNLEIRRKLRNALQKRMRVAKRF